MLLVPRCVTQTGVTYAHIAISVRSNVIGGRIMLEAGRSRVRIPIGL
jgi:hypothetical protein